MTPLRTLGATAIALAGLLVATFAASAAPATANVWLNVRTGPGLHFPVVDTLRPGQLVDASSCTRGWCRITQAGPHGWASANYLTFRAGPRHPHNPRPDFPDWPRFPDPPGFPDFPSFPDRPGFPGFPGGGGHFSEVCVYDGANFSGRERCVRPGQRHPALGRVWNDRISSVRIRGNARIELCRNRNYRGFCRTVTRSEPYLGRFLNNQVSSARVF